MSKDSIAIAGLFGTIANLQSNDFNMRVNYSGGLDRIAVVVSHTLYPHHTDELFMAYTTDLDQMHALEDDLVELKEEWSKK